jgi:hypothetical protein
MGAAVAAAQAEKKMAVSQARAEKDAEKEAAAVAAQVDKRAAVAEARAEKEKEKDAAVAEARAEKDKEKDAAVAEVRAEAAQAAVEADACANELRARVSSLEKTLEAAEGRAAAAAADAADRAAVKAAAVEAAAAAASAAAREQLARWQALARQSDEWVEADDLAHVLLSLKDSNFKPEYDWVELVKPLLPHQKDRVLFAVRRIVEGYCAELYLGDVAATRLQVGLLAPIIAHNTH